MRLVTIALALLLSSTPALAARFDMQLRPGEDQTVRMQNGIGALDSYGTLASVRLIETEEPISRRAAIALLVMNNGERAFNFGPENVTARLADGRAVPIITYDQLAGEERRRRGFRRFMAVVGAAAGAMNSGQSTSTVNYGGTTYGRVGGNSFSAYSSGTATVTTYDPAQASLARAAAARESRETFDRLAANHAARIDALQEHIRTTTVDPGQMFGGTLMFELPPAVRNSRQDLQLTFSVTIEGEVHEVRTLLVRD